MDTLILEDFRCFAGRNEVPIRPLTLLVGENSTGKTSFLAAVSAAYARTVPDFNEPPFQLGSYDQIANHGADPAKGFVVGMQFAVGRVRDDAPQGAAPTDWSIRVEVRFTSVEAQPAISDVSVKSGEYKLNVRNLNKDRPEVSFLTGNQVVTEQTIDESPLTPRAPAYTRRWPDLTSALHAAYRTGNDQTIREHESEFDFLILWAFLDRGPRPYAVGPTRARPQRTYDPVAKPPDPEGGHIPIVLAVSSDALPGFKESMEEFGKASGLYSKVSVRKLGSEGSDPFQIEVELPGGGRARNLIDVGYGVSQAIPIVVDCVSASFGSTLLIQQPEVHLHPRAQAAMGSFFAQLAASGRNDVIVETHSDYLIDRVRMDVRDEQIKASDVMILYFEQAKGGVKIHPIEIDAAGNITGVPADYRRFFLDEQRRFLGVD